MRARISACCAIVVAVAAGCVSGNIRDDFVTGWRNQRDVHTHQYVHQSFAQDRRWAVQRTQLVQSKSLDWPLYARPALATAVRTQTIAQDRGRAITLERFLEHMGTTPSAEATAAWLAAEAVDIERDADDTAARSGDLIAALGEAQSITDSLFQRIEDNAAARGVVRGRALQHGDLRRTTQLYFQARDDDVEVAGEDDALSASTGDIGAPQDALMLSVNRMLERTDLRQTILRPRRCEHIGTDIICTPQPGGIMLEESKEDTVGPIDDLPDAGQNAREARDRPRRDFFEDPTGW